MRFVPTPLSPLLANIALYGMEERVKQYAETLKGKKDSKEKNRKALSLIRYADDFVIMHEDLSVVLKCKEIIAEWLSDMGLELKPSKTKLTHTLIEIDGNVGFEFLGFHVQQHKVGNYRCAKNTDGTPLSFKTLITPSKAKIKTHLSKIAEVIETHKTAPQAALISKLNPIIRGWSNYYSTVCSKETYSKVDHLIYDKLRAWGKSRVKGDGSWYNKYWLTVGTNKRFRTNEGDELTSHSDTAIVRHVKVKGKVSPFDGNWSYWSARRGAYPGIPTREAKLLKKQKGCCSHCGLYFTTTDSVEVDHIIPKSLGGKNTYDNYQLLHRHCHDTKTAADGSLNKNFEATPF
ncbi:group II intron maturase-specific domain-containing protein [Microcoleus sp. N3A4]|uniref:group II intron maturase-specific domain-containing protein n=1 Tax=Microcoleus sp. N3A4 TaxID=3055379 RepID=UPI002FD58838